MKEKLQKLNQKTAQVYTAFKSKKTPWYCKVLCALLICYALSPIDLIPDFIPLLGYLDDLLIIPLLIFIIAKLIPKDLWEEFEKEANEIWKDGKPTKWYFAIPIVLIWLVCIALITYLILK